MAYGMTVQQALLGRGKGEAKRKLSALTDGFQTKSRGVHGGDACWEVRKDGRLIAYVQQSQQAPLRAQPMKVFAVQFRPAAAPIPGDVVFVNWKQTLCPIRAVQDAIFGGLLRL